MIELRDLFAGLALVGQLSLLDNTALAKEVVRRTEEEGQTFEQGIAAAAYEFADAMMEARK